MSLIIPVPLHIAATDLKMRTPAKGAGARWDPENKLWYVKYGRIAGTPLEKHLYVDDT